MAKTPEAHLAYIRAWRKDNRERVNATARKNYKKYTAQDPLYARKKNLLKEYQLTHEQYEAMYEAQGGRCAVCGATPARLLVDHDHATGTVRGLLCRKCNSGIGMLSDDLQLLLAAVAYLRRFAN
jgi:hypothetical protein